MIDSCHMPLVTQAQVAAVAACDLPFELSAADIARQFDVDGSPLNYRSDNPRGVARNLARMAMNGQVELALAA